MKSLAIDELNELYETAKALDKETVAEMRSAILLIAGEHYSKRLVEWYAKTRGVSPTVEQPRLRITKNWLHKASRLYVSSILSKAPSTVISPRNPTELQDQKAAELNESVRQYLFSKYKVKAKIRDFCNDYVGIGEWASVIKWDPMRGDFKGYEQAVDEQGMPIADEMGQPQPDEEKPVFSGEFVIQRIYPHNIFRDPSVRQMNDAHWIGFETVESTKSLKKKYRGDKEKLKLIEDSSEEYVVFDANKAGYSKEKDQTVIKEIYYKKCADYPEGYYYIFTKAGILAEGTLPGGVWPIVWCGFDEHATKCRATGIVKVARPWQAEINRAASQQALHGITVADDKILYQSGTKVSQSSILPGVRGITYQGAPPTILPGRTGEQFSTYIREQEDEMNRALMLDQIMEEKTDVVDPVARLFTSMVQSSKFSIYAEKFGESLVTFTEILLDLARFYLPDDEFIAAVGKSELINISEFRTTSPLCYSIIVQEQNDTVETKLGKYMVSNMILQYAGSQLNREDIGKLVTDLPFGNWQEAFKDFTADSKNVKNDFLAMERGEMPQISPEDDSKYVLKQVAGRKKERDFKLLSPEVQNLFNQYEQIHMQKLADEAQQLKAAQSEFIPTGGALVACDVYVPAEDPTKAPKRARIPYQAIDWLIKTLETQGMSMQAMESMNQAQMSEVAHMMLGGGMPQTLPPPQ